MALYSTISTFPIQFLHISLLCLSFCLTFSSSDGSKNVVCIGQERDALLEFKNQTQYDHCGLTDTWVSEVDCCTWKGVTCNNRTGHVIRLDLRGGHPYSCLDFYKEITPSLGDLQHLEYLDLSLNNFYELAIPSFIGSLTNLRYLNLSNSNFIGEIPDQLGILTRLVSLDLSTNYSVLFSNSLDWLLQLTLLKDINLSGVKLKRVTDWPEIVSRLPLLEVLKMEGCGLSFLVSSSPTLSFESPNLRFISLRDNHLTSLSALHWLLKTTPLSQLEISTNYSSFERSLKHLDLSSNLLKGSIPNSIGNFPFLYRLDLSNNLLSGTVPREIGNLKSLSFLDLHTNSLASVIPDTIWNMTSLTYLDLSYNSLKGIIPTTIGNLESLKCFNMAHNRLLSTIPTTIENLKSLTKLDISANSLSGIIPNSIQNLGSLEYIDLSGNSLSGLFLSTQQGFSNSFKMMHSLVHLDLSNNNLHEFSPSAMEHMKNIAYIDLSNNQLQGPISNAFGTLLSLSYLDLSKNNLDGSIPNFMGDLKSIEHIDLSNNQLQGPIPSAFGDPSPLSYLDLSSNYLEGNIPSTLAKHEGLKYLDLSNNDLSGDIPCQFGYFNMPSYINLSYNNLSGLIPKYLVDYGLGHFQGNPHLRRKDLQVMCEGDILPSEEVSVDGEGLGLYISIAMGFIVGFWGFLFSLIGSLTINISWRILYFRFLDNVTNKIYVTVVLCFRRCRRTSRV